MIKTPPNDFAKRVDSIKGGLAQINAESSVLLDKRVGEMQTQLNSKLDCYLISIAMQLKMLGR